MFFNDLMTPRLVVFIWEGGGGQIRPFSIFSSLISNLPSLLCFFHFFMDGVEDKPLLQATKSCQILYGSKLLKMDKTSWTLW